MGRATCDACGEERGTLYASNEFGGLWLCGECRQEEIEQAALAERDEDAGDDDDLIWGPEDDPDILRDEKIDRALEEA